LLFVLGLFGDLFLLDLFELRWTELRLGLVHGSRPSPRKFAGIAGDTEFGGKIYVFGGTAGITGCKGTSKREPPFRILNIRVLNVLGFLI
jgi:hypothetical protein